MAAPSTEETDEELTIEARLQFAARTIAGDQNLRTLVKIFLSRCNVLPPNGVFDLNPVQNAYNQGYQAAGYEFASMLTTAVPQLMPALLLEELAANADE